MITSTYQNSKSDFTELCQQYSDFNREEIDYLYSLSEYLPLICEVSDTDIYIDIRKGSSSDEAVVVAEALMPNGFRDKGFLGETIYKKDEPAVFRTLDIGETTQNVLSRTYNANGNLVWTRQSVVPVKYHGKILAVLIMDLDETRYQEASDKIEKLQDERSALTDVLLSIIGSKDSTSDLLQIQEGILMFDPFGKLCYHNQRARQLLLNYGYEKIEGLHLDEIDFFKHDFSELLLSGTPVTEEINRDRSYFNIRALPVKNNSQIAVILVIEDISDYKNKSLELNIYMSTIRENQHRVKNNLQTISSLLRMQARHCTNEEAKSILNDSIMRIESIAANFDLYHQELSENKAPLISVLKKLKLNYYDLYREFYDVRINILGDDVIMDSAVSGIVVLIVNELIQNAYKHAFSETRCGNIDISVIKSGAQCTITVMNDGKGFDDPDGTIFGSGMGTMLIKTFIKDKLRGTYKLTSDVNGTMFTFTFTLKDID